MKTDRIDISAGAILTASALWFFMDVGALAALMLAVLCHECGHVLALRALGCRIDGFSANISGARLDYRGFLSRGGDFTAAVAGPVAGLLWALMASAAGRAMSSGTLLTSAGISLALSAFNLIPALPLDGGRIVEALGSREVAARLGLICAALLLVLGLLLLCQGAGAGLFVAGIWLLLAQADL